MNNLIKNGHNEQQELIIMSKKLNNVKKSVETHTIQAHSINHHEEISEDFFPTLLDPEGTLADCYIMHLDNEQKKSKRI